MILILEQMDLADSQLLRKLTGLGFWSRRPVQVDGPLVPLFWPCYGWQSPCCYCCHHLRFQ